MSNALRNKGFWVIVVLTAAAAGFLSYFAYNRPDALEYSLEKYTPGEETAAKSEGAESRPAAQGQESYTGPMQDYSVPGVERPFISGGLAGIIGAAVTFIAIVVVGRLLQGRARKARTQESNGQRSRTSGTA